MFQSHWQRFRGHLGALWLCAWACFTIAPVSAQSNGLAATLEVLAAGVDVKRVDTVNWIAVSVESIIGTGDTIRTNETGRARITFFDDGTDVGSAVRLSRIWRIGWWDAVGWSNEHKLTYQLTTRPGHVGVCE